MKKVEIPKWLEALPLAPEFRPTDTEFADPIAYISKIEKEASAFGICKVIPPLHRPSRKYVLHNLNQSLSRNPELGSDVNLVTPSKTDDVGEENCGRNANNWESRAVFTTRHQELGCEKGKKVKGVTGDQVPGAKKQVWQSGEVYSLEQFEAKAKNFARSQLGMVKDVNPFVVEAMFWKAASEKPIYVEYANDVPGSGFAEPEGLFHYFHKRRRRRKRNSFDRNKFNSSCSKNGKLETVSSSFRDAKDSGSQNNPNLCTETASSFLPSDQSHQGATFPAREDSNSSNEMEGTAGWKLSNSPWNLQVIARSPGSLTRFMPDDIPGVTSPMVYIGMLFSWFAWHVEDHELHSLNFLHMGSPKTWYAVPGDYAFNFEETIHLRAFGGNTDQLVALSLLGEKTTVLPPEVFVASGIPCCRLVQNPGEFVVTFPRAYHIGFSHGFNCGEAANFGTPKWLTVAKEAAVRRAAMNQLPMLSHQQLLYLLTMSFISRIPRSLLPGVRSSRLRDRQKEERELLVKRAFIEDILYENNLMSLLLQSNPSFHMVLWDVESLPSSSKKSELCKDVDAIILTEKDYPVNGGSMDHTDKLSKYIGAVGFDLNDDDLAYDFQMDSGALPCVACGILGFPFMTVVQPSEAASVNLLLENPGAVPMESHLLVEPTHVAEGPIEDALNKAKSNGKDLCYLNEAYLVPKSSQPTCSAMEQSLVPDHSSFKNKAGVAGVETANRWNVSNLFLKPRIFCLEHAIQVEELLRSKGGSNVLVICHSDFQKIKTHAAVVAEEIGAPFNYIEIPPSNASQENLDLIAIAIDSEEQTDCVDWTSKLSINLQHYVKVKRNSPSKNLQYLLNLGRFFGDGTPISNASSVKWSSRKLRSKRHLKLLLQGKPSVGIDIIGKDSGSKLAHKVASKDSKIIQYSRKKYKSHSSSRTKAPADRSNLGIDPLVPSSLVSDGKSELQHEVTEHLSSAGCVKNASPPLCADPFIAPTPTIENVESQTGICKTNKTAAEEKVDNSWHDGRSIKKNEKPCSESPGLPLYENGRGCTGETETSIEEEKTDEYVVASETCAKLAENDFGMLRNHQSDADTGMKEASGPSNCLDYEPSPVYKEQIVEVKERSKSSIASGQQQHILTEGNSEEKAVSSSIALSNESTSDLIEDIASEKHLAAESCNDGKSFLAKNRESDDQTSSMEKTNSIEKTGHKRKRDTGLQTEDQLHVGSFIKSPCEGLRPRARKDTSSGGGIGKEPAEETVTVKKSRKASEHLGPRKDKKREQKGRFKCDLDGCNMSFQSRAELVLHKGNRCPVEGCRRKFSSHRYAKQHQRVHDDDRPLKCPWDGCKMSFKWAWARTEHLRVHTGEKPYMCKVKGCGLTFRFVSDFSRHRRKKGHYVKTPT